MSYHSAGKHIIEPNSTEPVPVHAYAYMDDFNVFLATPRPGPADLYLGPEGILRVFRATEQLQVNKGQLSFYEALLDGGLRVQLKGILIDEAALDELNSPSRLPRDLPVCETKLIAHRRLKAGIKIASLLAISKPEDTRIKLKGYKYQPEPLSRFLQRHNITQPV